MEQRYKELIEAMYGGKDKVDVQAPVTYRDGRKGMVTTGIQVRSLRKEAS
jgi:long-chain acyl-CoA synthetase